MNAQDKILIKDSALVTADAIVDEIAKAIPVINIAWGLSKAMYGAGMKLRQNRALEWVEMMRDNPQIFIKDLLEQTSFQDGFVYALEKYLIERNENKRKHFRNIFLGFSQTNDKNEFHIEKLIHTLSQIDDKDINLLREIDPLRIDDNYQLKEINADSLWSLIHAGLVLQNNTSRFAAEAKDTLPFINMSSFGKEFIKYITG